MKVLVTGGSGFLGSHVAEILSRKRHGVRALVRRSSNTKFLKTLPGVELAEGSVEDALAVRKAVEGVDAIVHSAGLVKARTWDDFQVTNVVGTRNLLEAARDLAPGLRRFVHVSSLEAAGPSRDGAPVPVGQEEPVTPYGRSKLLAEKEVLARKDVLPVVVLRPGAIYGPRDVEILEAFRAVKNRQYPVIGDGSMLGSYVYGPDCAEACVRAIEADIPSGKVYFVDDGAPLAMRVAMGEILPRVVGAAPLFRFGVPLRVLSAASVGVELYGRVRKQAVMLTRDKVAMLRCHWVCESQATRDELGWTPTVTFEEGAKQTVAWYRENGWL